MRKIAIILFNLGGPDQPAAVRPFLFNLFHDPAIIAAPQPMRWLLAQFISRSREQLAKANYALMGGASPILPETQAQARALETELSARALGAEFKCFIAMRYWRPFAADAAREAAAWGASEAVLLPLYPQYSTTTTASSLKAWRTAAPNIEARAICCYPAGDKFAAAHAEIILDAWRKAGAPPRPRVLFSAHGLPQRIVDAGDPYQWQVEQSYAAVRAKLPGDWQTRVCYQSRVGPLKWIGPSTEEEIHAAAHDKQGVIIAPVAFVSEHVETLVELDIEYAAKARALALPYYVRAPALGVAPGFIATLADLVARALASDAPMQSESGARFCPAAFGRCPLSAA